MPRCADAAPVERPDQVAVAGDPVVALVGRVEALLGDRFEAQEQRLAPARGRQTLQLRVLRGRRGALARPPLPERSAGPEQRLRVARVGADVVVPEHDRAGGAPRHFAHDGVDRPVAHGARSVQERDRAIVASVGTAAGGDRHRLSVPAALDQVPPGRRLPVQARAVARAVDGLEPPRGRMLEQTRPRVLRLAHHHRIGVLGGFPGEGGRVGAADHDGHPPAPEHVGDRVGVRRRRRGRGDPDQVRRAIEIEPLDDLVGVVDVVLRRGQGRDQRHRELRELDQARPAQSARLRRFRGDQVDPHVRSRRRRGRAGASSVRTPRPAPSTVSPWAAEAGSLRPRTTSVRTPRARSGPRSPRRASRRRTPRG